MILVGKLRRRKKMNAGMDESKIAYYIRTESERLYVFLRDDISGNVQDFCRRVKQAIQRNLEEGTDTVGFDIIHDSKKGCRIVDRTTQIPCTDWHTGYWEALCELRSIVN